MKNILHIVQNQNKNNNSCDFFFRSKKKIYGNIFIK